MNSLDKFPPEELDLKQALIKERELLNKVEVPVITISATYRKELASKYQIAVPSEYDVVFSRAHYSMAEAVRQAAQEMGKTTSLSDPTNFVGHKEWAKVEFTEKTGKLMARYSLLKWLKDRLDTFVRNKLPINKAVTAPLKYLTEEIACPIISLHYETGNLLVKFNKRVVQVVTDPHVRPQYLDCLPSENITYCLFDEETKKYFLEEAERQNKKVNDNQLIVTGPPVDPRISRIGRIEKKIEKDKPLNVAICTGGLGTNLAEIKEGLLDRVAPMFKFPKRVRLFLYAGTHRDFRDFFEDFAAKINIRVGNLDDESAEIRILYEDSIIDANNNLIKYMFPWAQVVVTKPSGDMAYEAAAAGCCLIFLKPWGVWEENIEKRFVERKIGFDLDYVIKNNDLAIKWWENEKLTTALKNAHNLPEIFRNGAENIVKLQNSFLCSK